MHSSAVSHAHDATAISTIIYYVCFEPFLPLSRPIDSRGIALSGLARRPSSIISLGALFAFLGSLVRGNWCWKSTYRYNVLHHRPELVGYYRRLRVLQAPALRAVSHV
jgi:hypothetical protein